jgi:hypothetical protein
MKKTNRILAIILAILMVISIIPITASAATYSGTCGDNLIWTYDSYNGRLTISGTGAMYDYNYNNRPWESYEDKIKKVVLEDGITSTGSYAFFDFDILVNVTICDSLIALADRTFSSCDKLSSITIPDGVTTIGNSAFSFCDNLETALIPDSVTSIGKCAFDDCYELKSINIPDGVTLIEDSAFNCCKALTEVTIPNSVTEIGLKAFYGCDGLTEIIIPDSVTTIGAQAFEYCDGLTSITLGSGVETIGKYAVGDCINITNLTIPANVTTIEDGAFRNCESMLNITVDSNNPNYSSDEYGVLFNKDKTVLMQYTLGRTVTDYDIPDTVTEIGYYAFANSNGLTDVVIPDSVTTIGVRAFSLCKNLKSITFGTNITTLEEIAFYHSDRFITFNYKGTSNQWNELLENNSDKSGILPICYAVHCSDKDIYPSCGDNVSWKFDYDTGVLTLFGTGDMDNYEYSTISGFCNYPWRPFYYQIKEVIICDGVTSIGNAAFCECDNLTNITIPDSVTKIGDDAFYLCDIISNIVVPDSVTTIGDGAFSCCYNLSNVTIGDGVTTMGENVFHGCRSLTSIVIPINVTSIGDDAFKGCSGITDVYYEGTEEQWKDNFVIYNGYIVPPTEPFENAIIHYNYHIHRYTYSSVVTAPTCTEQGYTTYTCECGDSCVDDYVDALGHTPTNAVEENYVLPTCTENGSKDAVVYCSVCEEEISRETEIIQATGHADNDGDGYCDACNEQHSENNDIISVIKSFIQRIINLIMEFLGMN